MTQIHSTLACGLPFYQTAGDETQLSIRLRTAAIAIGLILMIGGVLALFGVFGTSPINNTSAFIAIPIGGALTLTGVSIKHEEVGHFLPKKAIAKIQSQIKSILEKKEVPGIHYYNGSDNHRIFSIDIVPYLIFKMHLNKHQGSTKKRYEKIIQAQALCDEKSLDSLLIPEANLFTVEANGQKYDIIAEQKLVFKTRVNEHVQIYEQNADKLEKVIRHFAIFICETGYSDVDWRNNPFVLDERGDYKIALIDIEEWLGAEVGLYGKLNRSGLMKFLNPAHVKMLKEIAREHGFDFEHYKDGMHNRFVPRFDDEQMN